jgi:hypothetical protein
MQGLVVLKVGASAESIFHAIEQELGRPGLPVAHEDHNPACLVLAEL